MNDWQPIADLSVNWKEFVDSSLHALANVWREQKTRLEKTHSYRLFLEKMRRKIAIETGIIERLYTIDRGITRILIEQGIDASLIPHGTSSRPALEIVTLIRDHEAAIDQVFNYVGSQRELSVSFVKQLHQLLTRNQQYAEAVDQFGKFSQVLLIRGDWKKFPNNPTRFDGTLHYYSPPEQVASEMDQLIEWHNRHLADGVSPEVEAAWLHHRFTQIHPFQDGNGRVARNLASLVFIKHGWFPLVVVDEIKDENESRTEYIDSLEKADTGDLHPLINFFAASQRRTFVSLLSLSEEAIVETTSYKSVLDSVVNRIAKRQVIERDEAVRKVETQAEQLFDIAHNKLIGIEREITTALRQDKTGKAWAKLEVAKASDPHSSYYRFQIVRMAQSLNYYANLNGYKSWLRLAIRIDDVQTEILFSFHVLGREPQGVMVCSACAYRRLVLDENGNTEVEGIEPLSSTPLEFTYQEASVDTQERFNKWFDVVIVVGMEYWRRGI